MSLVRWNPRRELATLSGQMDRLFDEFFGRPFGMLSWPRQMAAWAGVMPRVDVYETDSEIVAKAELPGVKKEDVEVTVDEGALILKGETKHDEEVKEEDYYRCERSYGAFERTVPLPAEVKAEEVKAKFADGVLEIRMPKVQETKPKGTKVKIE